MEELVKDLREISGNRAIPVRMAETAKEAADAIEELSEELIELKLLTCCCGEPPKEK